MLHRCRLASKLDDDKHECGAALNVPPSAIIMARKDAGRYRSATEGRGNPIVDQ